MRTLLVLGLLLAVGGSAVVAKPEVVGLPAGTYSLEVDPNGSAGGAYQLRILTR